VTFLVAVASFYLIERPIRHGAALRGRSGALATALSILVTLSLVILATSVAKSAGSSTTLKRFSTSSANLVNPVRVMVVGDSTALTLAFPLSARRFTHKYDAILSDQAVEGCGVITSDENTDKGNLLPSAPECATTPPPGTQSFFDKLAHDVVSFRPDTVALLVGRWEVHDQVRNGQTISIEDPAFQADVRTGLEKAIRLSTAHGAHVVLYTQMCADSGRQPDGSPWPEDSPTRLATYNAIARSVAAKHPKTVRLFDLNRLVCPRGHFMTTIRHMAVRQADGIHIDITAGSFFGPRLWPALIAAGDQAREARHAAKH
jgi:hypothetical protein